MKSVFWMLKLTTLPQIMQPKSKCTVDAYANTHDQKWGSNPSRALRTKPDE